MPKSKGIFSSRDEIEEIVGILKNYVRLPFTTINIPGAVMEGILGHVRGAEVLRTYDFIDVVDRENEVGWQIKSTLAGTPVTWKRAKIPNSAELIDASEAGMPGLQALGDAIIEFCNEHARESMAKYGLSQIGYARLVLHREGDATYFERLLCSEESPNLFNSADFSWKWSHAKKTKKKEQLTALHGTHIPSGKKWFAWHGRGENQLHFSGEGAWWPSASDDPHAVKFRLPSERLSVKQFADLLAGTSNPLPRV
jgi:hypothetical protein